MTAAGGAAATEPRQAQRGNGCLRTCVGCRRNAPPAGWMRVAAGKDGQLRIGRTAPGRGAWVCSTECFDRAMQRGALARSLRREIASTEAAVLRARLEAGIS